MRVLFTCVPGYGHLLPLVPVARALVDAGHEVRVASSSRFVPVIERCGLTAVAAGLDWLESAPEDVELGEDAPSGLGRISWIFRAAAPGPMVRDLLDAAASWTPDLVVFDNVERGGLLYAEVTATPYVFLAHDTFLPSGLLESREPHAAAEFRRRRGLDRYHEVRAEFGLAPDLDERRGHEQLVLLTTPRVLWTLPPRWALAGDVVQARPEPVDLGPDPELGRWLEASDEPVATVTLEAPS